MDSSRGWQAGRGWLIHDSHDSLGGPLALVPASGRREAVSRLSHENLEVEIADSDSGLVQVWALPLLGTWGDALGSSRARFGFGSLCHVEGTVTAGFMHWEALWQSSGLGTENLLKHQLPQPWSFLYLLEMPPLSYSKSPRNLYLCLDFDYFCSVANY